MTRWLLVLGLWGMLAGTAWAACTTQTIFLPDGSVKFCQTCCYGQNCTTTCL